MEMEWKRIIDFGPHPFGSERLKECGQYIYENMKSMYPDTRNVLFKDDAFEAGDWCLTVNGTAMESYVALGSGCGRAEGRIEFAGIHRIWDMYAWKRYAIVDAGGAICGYITVRGKGKGIPQTIAEGNTALPHFIVGSEHEGILRKAEENGQCVNAYANTSVIKGADGNDIVSRIAEGERRVVLMAHYDTVYNTAGAYDNSAGVAVAMEIARRIREREFLRGLDIAFMDGEEFMLRGAEHLANVEGENIDFVINIDGVGRENLLEVWSGPEEFERSIRAFLKKLPVATKTLYTTPPPPGSDHAPYYRKGIPACMLTFNDQGVLHLPEDVYDERKLENMATMADIVVGMLEHFGVVCPQG